MNGENQNILAQNNTNKVEENNISFGETMETVPSEEPMNQQMAMMGNISVEAPPASTLNIGVVNPLNGAIEVPDEEEEEELPREKTAAEIELERRNKSGLRFVAIFGLMVLIFILLLPFLVTLF